MEMARPRSKQSAIRGLPMPGASAPTSLQKFQASKASLRPSLLIPGSPTAEMFSAWNPLAGEEKSMKKKATMENAREEGRRAEIAMEAEMKL